MELTGKIKVPARPRFQQVQVVIQPHAGSRGDTRAEEEHARQGAPLAARQVQLRDLEGRQTEHHDVDQDVRDDQAEAIAGLGDAVAAAAARERGRKGLADRRALEDVDQHACDAPHGRQRGENHATAFHERRRKQPPV